MQILNASTSEKMASYHSSSPIDGCIILKYKCILHKSISSNKRDCFFKTILCLRCFAESFTCPVYSLNWNIKPTFHIGTSVYSLTYNFRHTRHTDFMPILCRNSIQIEDHPSYVCLFMIILAIGRILYRIHRHEKV